MPDRYPGYDVLRKRDSLSWNDATRRVIDQRLAVTDAPRFLEHSAWQALGAVCERIVPQQGNERARVPVAALVDGKLADDQRDGHRDSRLPPQRVAWQLGLAALDAEAQGRHGRRFHQLTGPLQDELLRDMQEGRLDGPAWAGMPAALFFKARLLHDIVAAYYAHPSAWSEMGFGGPAGPRGYVRMYFNRRDPWEAAEAGPGDEASARRKNQHVR